MSSNPAQPPPAPNESAQDDPSIPVLTEQLTLPPLDFDTSLPFGPSVIGDITRPTAPPPPPAMDAPPDAPVRAGGTGARASSTSQRAPAASPTGSASAGGHWARIEIELRSSILRELSEQLPQNVEQIVRERMGGAIDELLAKLAAETRLAVAASLREIVEQAVRAELQRLRNTRK